MKQANKSDTISWR